MADRFPLILNTSASQIQEIASGDQLDLTGNNIANAGIVTATALNVGTGVTITSAGAGFYAGIVTASNFVKSDGSTFGASSNEYYLKHIDSSGNASANGGNMFGGYRAGGQSATGNITSGEHNHAIGWECGEEITSGNYNTLYGHLAGTNIRNGNANVAMGYETLLDIRQNHGNVALGSNALRNLNGYGDYNFNVAIGYYALREANQAERNVGVGQGVGASLSNGDRNTFLGTQAGGTGTNNITTGSNNILLGNQAQATSATVSNEVTIGNSNINHLRVPGIGVSFSAGGAVISGIVTATNFAKADGSSLGGVSSDADGNTIGGTDAGSNLTTGTLYNTLFGYQAGQAIVPGSSTSNGDSNTFIGYEAGESATTAYENVAIGYQAGNSFTTLPRSTLVGAQAGKGSTNGNDGVGYKCVGGSAGGASGYGNSGYGKYALSRLTSGLNNTCVGAYAGNYLSDGDRNTIMGENAGHMVNGNDNVVIGQDAAYDDNNSPFNTGSNCIIIGSHAMPTGQAVSNEITLGNSSITKFRIPGISLSVSTTAASINGLDLSGLLREAVKVTAGKLSDNTNIDLGDGNVHYFTTQETTTSTPNLRFNGSTSLNNSMDTGESIAVTIITTAAAAGYSAQLTIDGSAVTENWVGGSAPSGGGSSGVDIYTYNIIKTASATFTVIANLTKTS